MALFSRKKNTESPASAGVKTGGKTEEKKGPSAASVSPGVSSASLGTASRILRSPRITEKGTMHAERGAYLFDVAPDATKHDIAQAVTAVYKVKPRMIRVVTIPSKRKKSSRTGKAGVKQGGKKAYVYLKKGETITIA